MKKSDIKVLFNKLKKTKYSKKNRFKFRNLVHKLEVAVAGRKNKKRGVWEYKITPTEYFFKKRGVPISKKYLKSVNTLSSFKVNNSFKLKKGIKIIPLHIRNKVINKAHINLLVIKGKNVYRVDPSYSKYSTIKEKNVKKGLNEFFKKYSLKYRGIYKNSKYIKHGHLCRFVTPLEYFHKNISYSQIKRNIINYFNELINN